MEGIIHLLFLCLIQRNRLYPLVIFHVSNWKITRLFLFFPVNHHVDHRFFITGASIAMDFIYPTLVSGVLVDS